MTEHNEFVNNRKQTVVRIFRLDELIYWLLTSYSLFFIDYSRSYSLIIGEVVYMVTASSF